MLALLEAHFLPRRLTHCTELLCWKSSAPVHRRMKNRSEQLVEYSYSSFSSDMCQMV